ncbi:Hypothetical predicted protein, partial [Pelobates cultripes]
MQPLEEWVVELGHLVCKELWVDNGYRTLRWYTVQQYPCLAEGNNYYGPGLLWESFDDRLDFEDPDPFRFWYIREKREDYLDLAGIAELQFDLDHLANLEEGEIKQDYVHLFQ